MPSVRRLPCCARGMVVRWLQRVRRKTCWQLLAPGVAVGSGRVPARAAVHRVAPLGQAWMSERRFLLAAWSGWCSPMRCCAKPARTCVEDRPLRIATMRCRGDMPLAILAGDRDRPQEGQYVSPPTGSGRLDLSCLIECANRWTIWWSWFARAIGLGCACAIGQSHSGERASWRLLFLSHCARQPILKLRRFRPATRFPRARIGQGWPGQVRLARVAWEFGKPGGSAGRLEKSGDPPVRQLAEVPPNRSNRFRARLSRIRRKVGQVRTGLSPGALCPTIERRIGAVGSLWFRQRPARCNSTGRAPKRCCAGLNFTRGPEPSYQKGFAPVLTRFCPQGR